MFKHLWRASDCSSPLMCENFFFKVGETPVNKQVENGDKEERERINLWYIIPEKGGGNGIQSRGRNWLLI